MSDTAYQVIIIGGGPAGLTAGLYTCRARLGSLLLERGAVGGQITVAEQVDNYPGFPEGISGYDLGQLLYEQATKYGLKAIFAQATGIELRGGQKVVKTTQGDFAASAVIVASGSERTKLGVPGEDKYTGRGVSYCATCDAAFFRDRPVAVVGGGNAAVSEALHLAKCASRVTVIHRRNQLRATGVVREKAFAQPNIDFLWDTVVEEIAGKDFVESISLRNVKTGQKSAVDIAGVFVSVGFRPNTDYLKGLLPLDATGAIITDVRLETGVPGIFAAGDVRQHSARQAIAAAGDGATAAIYAERFIEEHGDG
ncbi:MAG: thioredoxin-disulfide reductase [Chloroflexi bacterium]|nr:thioredoxin-disulfide reductase [Chloroflexota bacterium]